MLRNKELMVLMIVLIAITLAATIATILLSNTLAVLIILLTCLSFIIIAFYFTKWRYNQISELSGFLRQISNGDYDLDVRDNYEGELSILKNEIYKVTIMLSEHGQHLQDDKQKLTNAISDISHQLKTPLTSMMMMADLLSNPKLTEPKRSEFTRNIRVQLERMEWLVSSLLKLSKIDAGTAQFKKNQVNVHQLIQKAVDAVSIPMDIKQQALKVVGDPDVTFVGDFNWTLEALINILKNGVEHTPVGGEISIYFATNPLFTEIKIQDTGKGIPKKDLPYIFKRFYRGENAGDDSVGIGLAMAYSIITSQNGDIEVTNVKAEGTSFKVKFYK